MSVRVNGDGRTQARRYEEWRHAHRGKARFTSKQHAWRVIACMWFRRRQIDAALQPYVCRWTNDPAAGKTAGEPHIHIGHSRKHWTPSRWARYQVNRRLVWPYYRARRRARVLRKRMERT